MLNEEDPHVVRTLIEHTSEPGVKINNLGDDERMALGLEPQDPQDVNNYPRQTGDISVVHVDTSDVDFNTNVEVVDPTPEEVNFTRLPMPHKFETQVELAKIPTIAVTLDALKDMFVIIDESPEEVSWLGSVRREASNNGELFVIEEIFIPNQSCSSTSTEMTEEGIAGIYNEVLKRPNGTDVANRIKFWGHSHHTMGTFASGQDDDQMNLFKENNNSYFIRGIATKHGEIKFKLYLFDIGVEIDDIPWMIYAPGLIDPERKKSIVDTLKSKVSATSGWAGGHSTGHSAWYKTDTGYRYRSAGYLEDASHVVQNATDESNDNYPWKPAQTVNINPNRKKHPVGRKGKK